jgi:hypothetical protein
VNVAAQHVLPGIAETALPVAGGGMFPVRRVFYCVGRNYIDHIREMKEADERDPPFFFQKPRDNTSRRSFSISSARDYRSCWSNKISTARLRSPIASTSWRPGRWCTRAMARRWRSRPSCCSGALACSEPRPAIQTVTS